jgi:hypothetical protein
MVDRDFTVFVCLFIQGFSEAQKQKQGIKV